MALDPTVGGANANTYATLAEFNDYAAVRVPQLAWFIAASDAEKEAALQAATRALDAYFIWLGTAVDATQALTWPRSGLVSRNGFAIATTAIPRDLKEAQCEFAMQLGSGDRLSDNSAQKKGITSLKAGDVALSFAEAQGNSSYETADVTIRKAQSDLAYLAAPDEVRRLLVPSWFKQGSVKRPFVFMTTPGAR